MGMNDLVIKKEDIHAIKHLLHFGRFDKIEQPIVERLKQKYPELK